MKKMLVAAMVGAFALVPVVALATTNTSTKKDRTPPKIVTLHIQSNNTDPTVAMPGNTVSISFTTSERIETPVVLVNSKPLFLRPTNTSGNSWVATYTVGSKTPQGKVAYAIAMEDKSDNVYACTSPRISHFIPYCPPTDGSSVTVTTTPPVPDTTAPVIAAHDDVVASLAHAVDTTVAVTYTNPTATDDKDGVVATVCTPASGTQFGLGTTTVTCTAQDAAGNTATSTFGVGVSPFVPQPIVLASQPDESYMCLADSNGNAIDGWRACYTGGNSFSSFTTNLGQGSGLQAGALTGVTISLDPTFATGNPSIQTSPFRISIICYTDAAYTNPCTDWVAANAHNVNTNYYVFEDALVTTDNKHWTADLTTGNEQNFNGSSPVTFNSSYYYQLKIEDLAISWPMFGQDPALHTPAQPYWVLHGITQ